ncbi:MAG: hypothetical protein MUP36_02345, partial [Demequinaceae bacterium]|nr:hypothetical protein [Demequinaceae bacterium]
MKRLLLPLLALSSLAVVAACGVEATSTTTPIPEVSPSASPTGSLESQIVQAIDLGDVDAVERILDAGLSPDAPIGGTT